MKHKKLSIILLLVWMILIFVMSSFDVNESSNQSGFIANLIASIFKINNVKLLVLFIRKMAHFFEYFVLGILMLKVIISYNKYEYLAYIFSILYAISDEVHQLFVSGRSCQLMDILIDIIGSILGIIIFKYFINWKRLNKKTEKMAFFVLGV